MSKPLRLKRESVFFPFEQKNMFEFILWSGKWQWSRNALTSQQSSPERNSNVGPSNILGENYELYISILKYHQYMWCLRNTSLSLYTYIYIYTCFGRVKVSLERIWKLRCASCKTEMQRSCLPGQPQILLTQAVVTGQYMECNDESAMFLVAAKRHLCMFLYVYSLYGPCFI